MIKKTASSEIFDIYASRMISKRVSINKTAGTVTEFLKELFVGAEKVGLKELDATMIGKVPNPTAKEGLKEISQATEGRTKQLTQALVHSSAITESAEVILSKAKLSGYTGYTDAGAFLKDFSRDFKKMGEEFAALPPVADETALAAFYNDNKKAIDFYKTLEKDPELLEALKKTSKLGEKQIASGGRQVSLLEAESLHTQKGADEAAIGFTNKWKGRFNLASKVISLGSLGVIGVLAYQAFPKVKSIFGSIFASPDADRHIKAAKDAIDCINNIDLIPGSPAVSSREKIINNIEIFSRYENLRQITDEQEYVKTVDSAGKAAQELMFDASVEGSIQNFLALITQAPNDNLSGYSKLEAGGVGALVGGAGGFVLGGPLGAAVGAALAGGVGWWFISKYYEKEITCLGNAADAIKQFDDLFKSKIQESGEGGSRDGSSQGTSASGGGTSGAGVSGGASISLLENMVGAISQLGSKIYNVPGLKNVTINEKKILSKLVNAYGVSQASSMIFRASPNIEIILSKIPNPNLKGTINAATVEANPVLQELGLAIVFGALAAEKSKPISSNIISQSKIKEDKMKKESKSINNQELIRKAAEARVSYFGDASLGLKDQLTKSYYTGLTGMYNEQPTRRSSDYKDLYGFQEETGQDLVSESHPKSVTLADAMGNGGLVENNLEQQQKSIYVATNTPSGNFQSKYAQTVSYLQKLAKAADSQGKKEVSKLINQTIQKLK